MFLCSRLIRVLDLECWWGGFSVTPSLGADHISHVWGVSFSVEGSRSFLLQLIIWSDHVQALWCRWPHSSTLFNRFVDLGAWSVWLVKHSLLALMINVLEAKEILWAVNALSKNGAVCYYLSTIFSSIKMVAPRGREEPHFRVVLDHGVTATSLPSGIVECVELALVLITGSCLKSILAILR